MINWHVVRTFALYERDVSKRLTDILPPGDVFCPSVRDSYTIRGRTVHRIVGAYRGYTFARWDAADGDVWHKINDTKRVASIMGGEFPWPVLQGIVEAWQSKADDDQVVEGIIPKKELKKLGFDAGDHVRFTYGPFDDVSALCDWLDDFGAHLQIKGLLARDQGIYVPFVKGAVLVLDRDWKPQSKTQWRRYHRRKSAVNEKSGVVQLLS